MKFIRFNAKNRSIPIWRTHTAASVFSFPPKSPPPLEIPKTEDPVADTPNVDCSAVARKAERSTIATLNTAFMLISVFYQRNYD